MKTFTLKTEYGTYENCYLLKGNYMADNSIALEIWNDEEGPIANLTTCLGKAFEGCSFLDTNNSPWAEDFVKELGIAKPTRLDRRSGYCIYPLYKFNENKVNEYVKKM